MEQFSELQFTKFLDGVSATVTYGDYELSVVKHSSSYGGKQGKYEIGVFKGDDMVEMPGITQELRRVREGLHHRLRSLLLWLWHVLWPLHSRLRRRLWQMRSGLLQELWILC